MLSAVGTQDSMATSNMKQAAPVRAPELPPAVAAAQAEQEAYRAGREGEERRRQVRALVLIAAVALVLSMVRAGWERVFYRGWWWQW